MISTLTNPRSALLEAGRDGRPGSALLTVALWALLNLVLSSALAGQGAGSPPLQGAPAGVVVPGIALSAALLPFVWWTGNSTILVLAVRPFGGRISFAATASVVGVACAPWVAAYAIQIPAALLQAALGGGVAASALGWLSLVISLAALAWHVALVALGVSLVAGVGPGAAAGSCALTGLGCATGVLILGITLVSLLFGLGALAGP